MREIASLKNPLIQRVKRLANSKSQRRKFSQTILEGSSLIHEYLNHFPTHSVSLLIDDEASFSSREQNILERIDKENCFLVRGNLMQKISILETNANLLAIVPIPTKTTEVTSAERTLILEDIQDPGNLGSIVRSANAFHVDRVVLSKNCVDVWSPRALRGGMGAQFSLSIYYADLASFLTKFDGKVIGFDANSKNDFGKIDLQEYHGFIFGNEGRGLSSNVKRLIQKTAKIQTNESVESLNVAAAVAICCYEINNKKQNVI